MKSFSEALRRVTTLFLAIFLWLHALFFLNVQSSLISKAGQFFHLTAPEAIILALLIILSLAAGDGFWKSLLSLLFIYGFPFVVLAYGFYICFLILRALHRWFMKQAGQQAASMTTQAPATTITVSDASITKVESTRVKTIARDVLWFLLRPFRKFMFLWCILMLLATHASVVWICVVVVLAQLVWKICRIFKVMFFSDVWLRKAGEAMLAALEKALATVAAITPDVQPTNDLRTLWNQLSGWKLLTDYLKNSYLISRWVWVICVAVVGALYMYIAVLFSFAYYGIAWLNHSPIRWLDSLIISLFIPLYVADLPKMALLRFLAGIQVVLIVSVGIGTVVKFLRRHLDSVRRAAEGISDRLADDNVRSKYLILEAKFSSTTAPVNGSPTGDAKK